MNNSNENEGSYSTDDVRSSSESSHANKKFCDDSKIECPCHNFTSLSKIVDILSSEDRTDSMIKWLNGTTDQIAIRQKKLLSCGKRFQCRYRYGTSFAILRAIRDACVPFQLRPSTTTKSKDTKTENISYENSFPPLQKHLNMLMPSSTQNNESESSFTAAGDVKQSAAIINTLQTRKKKPKRRIRPQLITEITAATTTTKTTNTSSTSSIWGQSKGIDPPNESRGVYTSRESIVTPEKTTIVEVALKSPTKVSSTTAEETTEKMNRLVNIYVALIENMLVPSTPLEIHLLLELLLIDVNSCSQQNNQRQQKHAVQSSNDNRCNDSKGSILFFHTIFFCSDRCIQFSINVLTKLQKGLLQRLSPFLIKSLLRNKSFTRRCPAVAKNLNIFLGTIPVTEYTPQTSESITGTHAIFNLPFEPDRDSRNNWKGAVEIAMYQNREMSRDAFLSQLRFFMTAKSKVFLPEEVDKVQETAQYEARKMINNVSPHNLMWFAEFFCDLLLQVGLAPVEEMDQDLLKIVADDRDKLQKLHRRFSKKSPSRTIRTGFASTTTTTARKRNNNNNTKNCKECTNSPFQEALSLYFPGYQKYFFIFLHSVNSYNFGTHLLHQIGKKTADLISNQSPSGLEKRTMDLALLARFLGFLVFSPNWHEENINWNKLKPCICSYDCGLNLLESIGLPLSKIIQEAWDGGYTFLIVPWVTELLKMSKWDSISQSSMTFRQILANLRLIQSGTSSVENIASGSSMQLISFHIETFFNETLSLPKLTSLPDATISRFYQVIPDSLDNHEIRLSTTAIYACSPYMEDLCDIIIHLDSSTRQLEKTRNTKQKKLRLSIVSTTGIKARSHLGVESPSPLRSGSEKIFPCDNTLEGKRLRTQNKLTEGFFHQHRSLKGICDFTVEQTIKNLSIEEINVFVMKAFGEHNVGVKLTEREIEEIQFRAFQLSQDFLRNKLNDKLKKCLELFAPPDAQSRVISIAVNLSTDRGMNCSQVMIRGLISSSSTIMLRELEKRTETPRCKKVETIQIEDAIEAAILSIRNLHNSFPSSTDSKNKISLIEEALDCVEKVTTCINIPGEKLLRRFFEQILDLDRVAESVIQQTIQSNATESWIMLCTLFRLLSHLGLISVYWRTNISNFFGEDHVHLFINRELPTPSEKYIIFEQLAELLERRKYSRILVKKERDESIFVGIIDPVTIQF